jgi:hypothetical protein
MKHWGGLMNYGKCIECKKELPLYSKSIRCRSCENKHRNFKGKNHPNYKHGKSYNNRCIDCGIRIDYKATRCKKCFGKSETGENNPGYTNGASLLKKSCVDCGKSINYMSTRCYSCAKIGKLSPFYIDGKSSSLYTYEFIKIRIVIRKRDRYKCQRCGKTGRTVHHIDYDKSNNKPENLIVLCKSCHGKTNSNRDYWFAYFTYVMENR